MNDPVTFAQVAWMIGGLGSFQIFIVAFILRAHQTIHTRISNRARELADYKLQVANDYVSRESLREVESRIIKRLDKLDETWASNVNRKTAG